MEAQQEDRDAAPAGEATTTRFYGPPAVGKGALQWSPHPPRGWAPDERYAQPPVELPPGPEADAPRILSGLARRLSRPHHAHPAPGGTLRP